MANILVFLFSIKKCLLRNNWTTEHSIFQKLVVAILALDKSIQNIILIFETLQTYNNRSILSCAEFDKVEVLVVIIMRVSHF